MKRVTRYPKIRGRLSPMLAGRLINDLRAFSLMVTQLPTVTISRDPNDNFLLATAKAGNAEFLITGDARDVLNLKTFAGTRIISVRAFLSSQGRLP